MGKDEFLINANVYPGSSGSPVFLLDDNFYIKSKRYFEGRDKVRLLGILYSGIPTPVCKRVKDELLPTEYEVPMNICNIIRSKKIRDFESLLKEQLVKYGIT